MSEEKVFVEWADTKHIEEGTQLDESDTEILFKSIEDGTVNWVPKQYIKQMING